MTNAAQLKSWAKTKTELSARQREVFECLTLLARPMGAWEIAGALGAYVHAVRPRLRELQGLGLIAPAGERWEERTKRHETVWKALRSDKRGQLDLI